VLAAFIIRAVSPNGSRSAEKTVRQANGASMMVEAESISETSINFYQTERRNESEEATFINISFVTLKLEVSLNSDCCTTRQNSYFRTMYSDYRIKWDKNRIRVQGIAKLMKSAVAEGPNIVQRRDKTQYSEFLRNKKPDEGKNSRVPRTGILKLDWNGQSPVERT
jgi:hypothetical protein